MCIMSIGVSVCVSHCECVGVWVCSWIRRCASAYACTRRRLRVCAARHVSAVLCVLINSSIDLPGLRACKTQHACSLISPALLTWWINVCMQPTQDSTYKSSLGRGRRNRTPMALALRSLPLALPPPLLLLRPARRRQKTRISRPA